jgi:hypothetical protein
LKPPVPDLCSPLTVLAGPGTWARIAEVAEALVYQRGLDKTWFADIADAGQRSRGNVCDHVKT